MEETFKNSKTSSFFSFSSFSSSSSSSVLVKDQEEMNKKTEELMATLPVDSEGSVPVFYQFKGCWFPLFAIRGSIAADLHFQAQDSDIFLASSPKSGTTWMKALIFSVVNRNRYPPNESPLLTTHPHNLVEFIELRHYLNGNIPENLDQLPKPRLFATHSHYASLPHSIRHSSCQIVYVCRNPLDTFVSMSHFFPHFFLQQDLDTTYEKYCRGIYHYGPFWDSILGYWKASLENPEKVLFMKFEDLKEDIVFEVKRLAKFLGFPFSVEEENEGLVEEISRLCSFENLKNLEVNRTDKPLRPGSLPSNLFFRKGEVGDFVNHLKPSMVENLVKITQEKFAGSGLVFKYSIDKLQN